jgi:Tfp pilus assembly protein PilE
MFLEIEMAKLKRSGLKVIELMIAAAFLVIFALLFVPALEAAQEVASRTFSAQCW